MAHAINATPLPQTTEVSDAALAAAVSQLAKAVSNLATAVDGKDPIAAAGASNGVSETKSVGPDVPASDKPLFEALRDWRREEAKKAGVPPYIIAHDSTLLRVAQAKPSDVQALSQVRGFGPTKAERYGQNVLGVLRGA